MEKKQQQPDLASPLPPVAAAPPRTAAWKKALVYAALGLGTVRFALKVAYRDSLDGFYTYSEDGFLDSLIRRPAAHRTQSICPQADVLYPEVNKGLWEEVSAELNTEAFQNKALDWMRGAIQIPCVFAHFVPGAMIADERPGQRCSTRWASRGRTSGGRSSMSSTNTCRSSIPWCALAVV